MVYDESARKRFLLLEYEEALEELSVSVDRNFGDRGPDEERLSDLLKTIPKDAWRTDESIKMELKWLAVGRDSLADRAATVLIKRERPRK